ncbi:peroxisomal ATPase PEX1-like [Cydia strobilella]|uniref:peroxisomal ATPase PEX1-like n=1 Tax=Cydia strobilella TaxID=1100964 RepID=UPI003005A4E8
MLGGVRLQVTYTHEKTCFAYLSSKYSTNNEQGQSIQVIFKDRQLLLWVVYSNSVSEGHLACNPIHGRLLGLDEGTEVFVSPYGDVKVLDELYIDTDSPDDQEILEHNAELLQLRILDQLRLVVSGQKCVVWISVSLPIIFTPKQTGLLVNQSRIIVKVDAFNTLHHNSAPVQNTPNIAKEKENRFHNIGIINQGMLRPYLNPPKRLYLRALPIDSDGKRNLIHPYTVFMHEDLLEAKYKDSTIILATMRNIPSIIQDTEVENGHREINDLCVEIVPVNNIVFRSLCREVYNRHIPTVLIPKSLNSIINIEIGMRVYFTIIGDNIEQPDHVHIVTYSEESQKEEDIIEKFKKCVIDNTHSGKKFLINRDMLKQNLQICNGFLQFKLKPEKIQYTLLNSESFRQCTVSAKCLSDTDFDFPKISSSSLEYDCKNYCRGLKCTEELVQKVVSHLFFEIHREATFKDVSEIKSNVLITGLNGTGKSALCHIVQKDLTVWSHILHCRSLRGRKDISEALGRAILMCQERSPSVLICDDIDSLVPPNLEGSSPQDIAYYQRLAVVIKHLLQSCAGVVVLLTATSVSELHPTLRQFGGKPLFTAHFNIPELQQEERVELFKHLINNKLREQFLVEEDDFTRLGAATAGFSMREITDHLNKKIFQAVKKKKSHPSEPVPRLVESVIASEKNNAFDIWDTVGGMEGVKQELTECIFWPLMYPALFPSQSCGILLYGAPGTGKSHIGSSLARLHNMSLVVVKGPELLSKYIGQSEKAVRDVFDKADMKRPCILFFDEFDSLAPKRGHDSTGVTDRVVNQLLARLDGAEGGARGPVVAATSRPDLIDPALLRPGRLQRHIYCAPPDQNDRFEVLKTLSKNVVIEEDVDLQQLAEVTEGYSPADLKSLLVTAQLGCLEKQLLSGVEKDLQSVVVRKTDIQSALLETKPSLSNEQRIFYDMIYQRFRGDKLSADQKLMSRQLEKQRVTLA